MCEKLVNVSVAPGKNSTPAVLSIGAGSTMKLENCGAIGGCARFIGADVTAELVRETVAESFAVSHPITCPGAAASRTAV